MDTNSSTDLSEDTIVRIPTKGTGSGEAVGEGRANTVQNDMTDTNAGIALIRFKKILEGPWLEV
ncbi:hypothetical protein GcC1_072024 [Golovinomyces cichoracearum]|uniref:Uncharacterized protein n=1 Tax=Golovinomyces cichoracearum TaxID=62708 RepID=A0A420IP90_9PEZI|nr:hypothetical protein GcC1_072024 [Golovinomyces cichoracearum]